MTVSSKLEDAVTGQALLEIGGEAVDNRSNFATDLHQEIERRHQSFDDFKFVDRYIKSEAHILIRFRDRKGTEFIACLQRDDAGIVGRETYCCMAKVAGPTTFSWT